MSILKYIRRKKSSASIAKERLQIIISHEHRRKNNDPDYLPKLQKELVAVISKYVNIDPNDVNINYDDSGDCSILALNITLPESELQTEEV